MSYYFNMGLIILAKICIKMRYFIKKLQKSPRAGGSALRAPRLWWLGICPQTPKASGGWGLAPPDLCHPPIEKSWLRHC